MLSIIKTAALLSCLSAITLSPFAQAEDAEISDRSIAVTAVALSRACSSWKPSESYSVDNLLAKSDSGLSDGQKELIRKADTSPLYASEVRAIQESAETENSEFVFGKICPGFAAP
jgi:hypothetical protein